MSEVTREDMSLAASFWRVHPKEIQDAGMTRSEWYAKLIARHRIASTTALQAELAEARARIAVLEGALERIVDHCSNAGLPNEIVADRVVDRCDATARQALAGKEAP
jgi:hypothetical protein